MTKKADKIGRVGDWFVGVFSPKRAAIRGHFRRLENDAEYRDTWYAIMRARGYRAAKVGKGKTPWLGSGRSADAEIINDLPSLISKSRELNQDDPIGSGLTGTFVKNVIGTGLRVQARTDDPEKNKKLEAIYAERADFLMPAEDMLAGERQKMLFKKAIEDGNIFIKAAKKNAYDPIWFEAVEKDRVTTPPGAKPETEGGEIRDGVEKDKDGIAVAYWIKKYHPGDLALTAQKALLKFDRIPKEIVNHLRLADRPGQTHGVPMFHAILQDIHDLDLLVLASLKRTQIAACLSVFIETDMAIEDIADLTAEQHGFRLDQDLEPGMIFRLHPGEKIQTLLPNFPTPELGGFIIMLARRIGAALGVSWQVVLKDFSDSTYSSARTDLLEARQTYVAFQQWFIRKYLNWEWFLVLSDARLRGDPRMRGITDAEIRKVQWIGNGWKWVDPLKEAQGLRVELHELGITTLQELCAGLGRDWEAVQDQRLREIAREKKRCEELGLPWPLPKMPVKDVVEGEKDNEPTAKKTQRGAFETSDKRNGA